MKKIVVSLMLLALGVMVVPAPAHANGHAFIRPATPDEIRSLYRPPDPIVKIASAFQRASEKTVNIDGLIGGGAGAAVQKLAEPKAPMASVGWGFIYGTTGMFLVNFAKELRNEFSSNR